MVNNLISLRVWYSTQHLYYNIVTALERKERTRENTELLTWRASIFGSRLARFLLCKSSLCVCFVYVFFPISNGKKGSKQRRDPLDFFPWPTHILNRCFFGIIHSFNMKLFWLSLCLTSDSGMSRTVTNVTGSLYNLLVFIASSYNFFMRDTMTYLEQHQQFPHPLFLPNYLCMLVTLLAWKHAGSTLLNRKFALPGRLGSEGDLRWCRRWYRFLCPCPWPWPWPCPWWLLEWWWLLPAPDGSPPGTWIPTKTFLWPESRSRFIKTQSVLAF